MHALIKLLVTLSVCLAVANGQDEEQASSTDYSCVHANSWLLNTQKQRSDKYKCLVDITSSGFKNETLNTTGWTVTFTGIPYYDHVFSKSEIGKLNQRPKAATDFSNGKTTAAAGTAYAFGADIGYKSKKCTDGYWPPGPFCPTALDGTYAFPVFPSPEAKSGGCYVAAHIGYFINGVPFWSWSDERTYNDEQNWYDIALAFEGYDMDVCLGHTGAGIYHHHSVSPCLMNQLGDTGASHSPVHGFAYDGYPIYGPYQDKDTLAVSCWVARDYSDPLTGCEGGDRTCYLRDQYDYTQGTVPAPKAGPSISSSITTPSNNTIPALSGIYAQDYYHDPSCSAQGGAHLDSHNGHSHGDLGYHYHLTMSANALPTFPFTMGPKYYGCQANGACKTGNKADTGKSQCTTPFTKAAGKCTRYIGSLRTDTPADALLDQEWPYFV